ncbi:hypothetical protein ACVBGC_09600 [Burkholderia stagnalis]
MMKLEASICSSPENVALRLDVDSLPAYFEKHPAPPGNLPEKNDAITRFHRLLTLVINLRVRDPFFRKKKGADSIARRRAMHFRKIYQIAPC